MRWLTSWWKLWKRDREHRRRTRGLEEVARVESSQELRQRPNLEAIVGHAFITKVDAQLPDDPQRARAFTEACGGLAPTSIPSAPRLGFHADDFRFLLHGLLLELNDEVDFE